MGGAPMDGKNMSQNANEKMFEILVKELNY